MEAWNRSVAGEGDPTSAPAARPTGPVYLVIRTGDGVVRWMNVSEYLEQRAGQKRLQITFDGERLDRASVLRLRDELL